MHLPYIKKIFGSQNFKLVPLMVGQVPIQKMSAYAQALLPLFKEDRTLFVVSSDFCHWGANFKYFHQYDDEPTIHKSIERLDKEGMALIE